MSNPPPPAAAGPLENEGALRTRRVLLMEGFAVSLRLPEAPLAAPAEGAAAVRAEMSDGVFVRLMSLPKGKTLTARALRLVYPPSESQQQRAGRGGAAGEGEGAVPEAAAAQQPPNLRVVWAVMRNLRGLFSGKAAAGRGGKVSPELQRLPHQRPQLRRSTLPLRHFPWRLLTSTPASPALQPLS